MGCWPNCYWFTAGWCNWLRPWGPWPTQPLSPRAPNVYCSQRGHGPGGRHAPSAAAEHAGAAAVRWAAMLWHGAAARVGVQSGACTSEVQSWVCAADASARQAGHPLLNVAPIPACFVRRLELIGPRSSDAAANASFDDIVEQLNDCAIEAAGQCFIQLAHSREFCTVASISFAVGVPAEHSRVLS